jgi:hypothetical protein
MPCLTFSLGSDDLDEIPGRRRQIVAPTYHDEVGTEPRKPVVDYTRYLGAGSRNCARAPAGLPDRDLGKVGREEARYLVADIAISIA